MPGLSQLLPRTHPPPSLQIFLTSWALPGPKVCFRTFQLQIGKQCLAWMDRQSEMRPLNQEEIDNLLIITQTKVNPGLWILRVILERASQEKLDVDRGGRITPNFFMHLRRCNSIQSLQGGYNFPEYQSFHLLQPFLPPHGDTSLLMPFLQLRPHLWSRQALMHQSVSFSSDEKG